MTLPFERTLAMRNVRDFLMSLTRPERTPKVPEEIRTRARHLLKHFPNKWDIDQLPEKCPEIFGNPKERLS